MPDETFELDSADRQEYVDMSVENMILKAEKAQRAAAEKAKPAPAPASEQPTYPMTLPDGRIQYGSWNDLADPFKNKFHPRNDPNDIAYKTAIKELASERESALTGRMTLQEMMSQPTDANGRLLDEEGNPILSSVERAFVAKADREKELLETPVQWTSKGHEWLNPDLPEDDVSNDPTKNATVAMELKKRERARSTAFTNVMPRTEGRSGKSDLMREAGLLPPLDLDDPVQARKHEQHEQRKKRSEDMQRLVGQTPQAEANKQRRINELLVKGDTASRQLAADLMDGRA